jgi:putative pyruvate formate lyase activating enzyme
LKNTAAEIYTPDELALLSSCTLCPRECGVNRFDGGSGYCGADAGMNIASICIHRGEEPPVSGPEGICNIFFSGCNLRCLYCQNHEISRPGSPGIPGFSSLESVVSSIEDILHRGIRAVGFVSPSHMVPQMKAIIRELNKRGLRPITVYNTNAYDKPEVIESLDGIIDVYLPDFKYVTPSLSTLYSGADDYPELALRAIGRMYRQKGSRLHLDDEGRAEQGILIRHLVLPGHAGESIKVLETIAGELSPGIHLSLMSQYYPVPSVYRHPVLKRSLHREEYESVVRRMETLGFRNGWVQDMASGNNYRPGFSKDKPFEQESDLT